MLSMPSPGGGDLGEVFDVMQWAETKCRWWPERTLVELLRDVTPNYRPITTPIAEVNS